MAAPTKSDLVTLDFGLFGQPFVEVTGVTEDTTDFGFFGQPVVPAKNPAPGSPAYTLDDYFAEDYSDSSPFGGGSRNKVVLIIITT